MQEFPLHMFYYQRAYDYQSIMIRWMHMLPNNEPNNWQVANLDWHKSQQDVGVLHQYITLATTNHHHHRMDGPGPKSTCRNTRVQMTRLVLNHSMNMNIFYNNGEKYIDYIYIYIYKYKPPSTWGISQLSTSPLRIRTRWSADCSNLLPFFLNLVYISCHIVHCGRSGHSYASTNPVISYIPYVHRWSIAPLKTKAVRKSSSFYLGWHVLFLYEYKLSATLNSYVIEIVTVYKLSVPLPQPKLIGIVDIRKYCTSPGHPPSNFTHSDFIREEFHEFSRWLVPLVVFPKT